MVWFPEHITGSQILSIIHFLGPLVHLWASDGATPSPFPKELDVDRKGSMSKRFVHLCWSYFSSRLFDSSFLDLNSCYGIEGVRNTIPANLSPPPFPSYVSPSPRPHRSILISEKAPELYLLGQVLPILHSQGPGPPTPRGCVYRKSKYSGIRNPGLETQLCHLSAVILDNLPNLPEL